MKTKWRPKETYLHSPFPSTMYTWTSIAEQFLTEINYLSSWSANDRLDIEVSRAVCGLVQVNEKCIYTRGARARFGRRQSVHSTDFGDQI